MRSSRVRSSDTRRVERPGFNVEGEGDGKTTGLPATLTVALEGRTNRIRESPIIFNDSSWPWATRPCHSTCSSSHLVHGPRRAPSEPVTTTLITRRGHDIERVVAIGRRRLKDEGKGAVVVVVFAGVVVVGSVPLPLGVFDASWFT